MMPTAIPFTESFSQTMDALGPFEEKPHLAVAVSGGADSLCLALLLHGWSQSHQGKITALTVDHKLRPESTEEAYKVKEWLTTYGIEHHILTWKGNKKKSDLQNQARQARRTLLENWCRENKVLHLCLAHHADDQAETFMQRLLHGSGPIGLQAMSPCTYSTFGRILRPLLGYSKEELQRFLRKTNQEFIEDPSNQNPLFERTKLRALLPEFLSLTNTQSPIAKTIEKIGETNEIIFKALSHFFLSHVRLTEHTVLKINRDAFLNEPAGQQHLILSQSLQTISGHIYPFSGLQLNGLLKAIELNKNHTLGGCFIIPKRREIWIIREKRSIPPATQIQTTTTHWDHRFLITVPESLVGSYIIPHPAPYEEALKDLPSYVKETLPCIQDKSGKIYPFTQLSIKLSLTNRVLPFIKTTIMWFPNVFEMC